MSKIASRGIDTLGDAAIDFLVMKGEYESGKRTKTEIEASYGFLLVELTSFEMDNELSVPEMFDEIIKQIKTA